MRPLFLAALLAILPATVGAAPPVGERPGASVAAAGTEPKRAATMKGLVEPRLALSSEVGSPVRVALTFDACSGKTDHRILSVLVTNRIPATIFATARWLKRNPDTAALLKANPDLFEVENHGAMHVPAVDRPGTVYGIRAAGSPDAVAAEVAGGADALEKAGFPAPRWFRGATARYTPTAMEAIGTMGYRVAGYSLNGDDGASVAAATAEKRLAGARDGAVVIAHINQPDRAAGAGVARGILALKARGVTFVRLADAAEEAGGKTGH
ncbi:polysaccharide deacetylase family protein [Gellertiella hungarica]|uniref:Chitooligosaccharide deacetylase n=1 Tax=Gellertiella hungarica TaxID=1572859 RepID=A0A7W6NJ97_9HYPH|nr:polysaccharide deacetylase family protein [Gellertiella hungarica]MBB4063518.1 peptidoglycan/xylan/chitin deacetylase (PgdA/CDA1 family) [Gellertiella hungarica]